MIAALEVNGATVLKAADVEYALTVGSRKPPSAAEKFGYVFFDKPAGYKGHGQPTPYLGGTAIMFGILAAVLLVRGTSSAHSVIIIGALAIWLMGTIDDKVNLTASVVAKYRAL